MNEAQTRYDYIDPQLKEKGWDSMNSRVITEHSISEGRIEITGRRAQPINADYVLEYQSKKLAVIEAKKSSLGMTEGLEQAKQYGKLMITENLECRCFHMFHIFWIMESLVRCKIFYYLHY